ncbi:hypothetical protein PR003_g15514 [Phytophthora rubi]|uniref:Uncharacterized protein n=1 Tax=Phytophthora rubi TaxID=129364 RepID=A0A6A4EYM7_9STRA|nr:hypothetical protein PR002_g15241 [Phytophthora rubi]KAE9016136.1 hypothetical protein PR001_g14729 [Phytophthora rubi]KAE9329612.1 hypothetical protein PR003_g15514 [Phytophthora rubi]
MSSSHASPSSSPAFVLPASPTSSPVAASPPPPTQPPAVAPPATSPSTTSTPPAAAHKQGRQRSVVERTQPGHLSRTRS